MTNLYTAALLADQQDNDGARFYLAVGLASIVSGTSIAYINDHMKRRGKKFYKFACSPFPFISDLEMATMIEEIKGRWK